MKRNLDLLTSPGFVAGLLLLLANDLLLKPVFHNAFTGKLSDFAGLFVFPLFWSALAPRRRREIYVLTALGFVFWKSAYAQPLIDAWNSLGLLRVARVVDPTDLLALVALPASFAYLRRRGAAESRPSPFALRRAATFAVLLLSVFAFAATSYRTHFDYEGQEFTFADSAEGLVDRLKKIQVEAYQGNYWSGNAAPEEYTLTIPSDFCFDSIKGLVELHEPDAGTTRMTLRKLVHECPEGDGEKAKMLSIFLHGVVEKLQDDIDAHPPERGRAAPPAGRRPR